MRLIYVQVGLAYLCLIISSCYEFAAIIRARNEHLLSPETAKKYMRGRAIPIADLASSIRLYLLLRRFNGATPTNVQDA